MDFILSAAHVSPDGDVSRPDVPLDSPVGQVRNGEQSVEWKVEHFTPVHSHFEVVDEHPIGFGLDHNLRAGLPGTPGDGCGVLVH